MVNNIDAQKWIDEKYPKEGVCERDNDPENKGKTRKGITSLDIRKGKVGNGIFRKNKNLIEDLKLEGFDNLQKLTIFSHQLISLDLGGCPNLEELDCHGNKLTSLNVKGCSNLKKIDCSNNNIKELDLSTCTKLAEINCASNYSLEEVDISNCLKLTDAVPEFTRKENKLIRNISRITSAGDNDIRNILIVGMTGNGKSALANTLVNKGSEFKEVFKEGEYSISETKNFQAVEFEWEKDGKKLEYRIIDNIGFGDSDNLSLKDVLYEIGKAIHSAKEGINQVLFVFGRRFSEEQVSAFNTFKEFIAETGITRVTTLVRTHFPYFEDKEKSKEDEKTLLNESEEINGIIKSCNGIIHIDNPLVDIPAPDNEDENRKKNRKAKINSNKATRENSREIVLNHLVKKCSEIYKVEKWESIHNQVAEYMKRKEEIEKKSISSDEKQIEIENERQKLTSEVKVRLGVNALGGIDAYIEVGAPKNCCKVS